MMQTAEYYIYLANIHLANCREEYVFLKVIPINHYMIRFHEPHMMSHRIAR